jgi:hypothetical protein
MNARGFVNPLHCLDTTRATVGLDGRQRARLAVKEMPMPAPLRRRPLREAVTGLVRRLGAPVLGLVSCVLILLATRRLGGEVRAFCALGAAAVIGLWLTTADFRRDATLFAASSTLALVPIAALESGWIVIEGRGMALLIETFCLAILFVSAIEPLVREGMAVLQPFVHPGLSQSAPVRETRLRSIVVRCCVIAIGLLTIPAVSVAAIHRLAPV